VREVLRRFPTWLRGRPGGRAGGRAWPGDPGVPGPRRRAGRPAPGRTRLGRTPGACSLLGPGRRAADGAACRPGRARGRGRGVLRRSCGTLAACFRGVREPVGHCDTQGAVNRAQIPFRRGGPVPGTAPCAPRYPAALLCSRWSLLAVTTVVNYKQSFSVRPALYLSNRRVSSPCVGTTSARRNDIASGNDPASPV
jgi:hypothetical protein